MHYPLPSSIKEILRRTLESIGVERYSRMGKNQLDLILQDYLPAKGTFLEAGALDGLYASNTYYLERIRGLTGVLVEPVPHLFRQCVKHRRNSKVFNCALVSDNYSQSTVPMIFAENESRVAGHNELSSMQRDAVYDVPARSLTSLLEEAEVKKIDFFSLDVEGYEIEVMQGLDMFKFRPSWVLVECLTAQSRDQMGQFLNNHNYEFVAQVTPRDLLWRAQTTSPIKA